MIDKFRKRCLWRGSDINAKGYNLATWDKVTVPKDKGGLSVKNLYIQNDALLIKHLFKFYNRDSVPWVQLIWDTYYRGKVPHLTSPKGSFWWKDILKLVPKFQEFTSCLPGLGTSIGLWEVNLHHQQHLSQIYVNLFQYAKNENISLHLALTCSNLLQLFRIPMTRAAYDEFILFSVDIEALREDQHEPDLWIC
jgi:hypothetical protein